MQSLLSAQRSGDQEVLQPIVMIDKVTPHRRREPLPQSHAPIPGPARRLHSRRRLVISRPSQRRCNLVAGSRALGTLVVKGIIRRCTQMYADERDPRRTRRDTKKGFMKARHGFGEELTTDYLGTGGWVAFTLHTSYFILHTSHFTLLKWLYKQNLHMKPIPCRKRA